MPKPIGRKVEEIGPKPWAGEGNRSGGVGKPTLFVLNNGKEPGTGTVLLFGEDSKELNDKAKEQLNHILPLLMGKRQKIELRGHAGTAEPRPAANKMSGNCRTPAAWRR